VGGQNKTNELHIIWYTFQGRDASEIQSSDYLFRRAGL